MTDEESLQVFENLEEGDKVLFSDRKVPLEVTEVTEDRAVVEGPGGGDYEVFEDDGTLLWSKEGNRRYSSYCKNLRKVGGWKREDDTWRHSKTGNEISITENQMGYWTVESDDFDVENEIDLPMYGYSDKEVVEKEVEKFVKDHPEGRK